MGVLLALVVLWLGLAVEVAHSVRLVDTADSRPYGGDPPGASTAASAVGRPPGPLANGFPRSAGNAMLGVGGMQTVAQQPPGSGLVDPALKSMADLSSLVTEEAPQPKTALPRSVKTYDMKDIDITRKATDDDEITDGDLPDNDPFEQMINTENYGLNPPTPDQTKADIKASLLQHEEATDARPPKDKKKSADKDDESSSNPKATTSDSSASQVPAPSPLPCTGHIMVIDIGGNSARAWCFEDSLKPVSLRVSYPIKLWDGNPFNAGKTFENVTLTWSVLKQRYQAFTATYGVPKQVVCSLAQAVESPGPTAFSSFNGKTLLQLEEMQWDRTRWFADWMALNNMHTSLLAGVHYVERYLDKKEKAEKSFKRKEGSLYVMAYTLGSGPNAGYAVKSDSKVHLHPRTSWLYTKNPEDIKVQIKRYEEKTNNKEKGGNPRFKDSCRDTRYTYQLKKQQPGKVSFKYEGEDQKDPEPSYYDDANTYMPAVEEGLDVTLDVNHKDIIDSSKLLEHLRDYVYPRWVYGIPFQSVLRNPNIKKLAKMDSGQENTVLSPDSTFSIFWRQRVSQMVYAGIQALVKERGCPAGEKHVIIFGGNSIALAGKLHTIIARVDTNNVAKGKNGNPDKVPAMWISAVDGKPMPPLNRDPPTYKISELDDSSMPKATVTDTSGDTKNGDPPFMAPIPEYGGDCKFVVHLVPKSDKLYGKWYMAQMQGAAMLPQLELQTERSLSQYFPWRNPETGGWCSEDAEISFRYKKGKPDKYQNPDDEKEQDRKEEES
eukprot:TRINITY_DN82937_c0_g1_i1.p1 TRINITY_DN82937_c0_g1~~TRINITY_DN82937_c0_g1_i1.p1  ORF type:complete len:775 (+),score=183.28 TRINITY_DN82937_c0_g1_i1:88-2412(+)